MADAPDLGSGALRRGGSSPFSRTNFIAPLEVLFFLPKIRCLLKLGGCNRYNYKHNYNYEHNYYRYLLLYIKRSRSLITSLYVIINELELFN